jgi:hypothetical protein
LGNTELPWNNPRVFLDYQEKTVGLPQANSKETEKSRENQKFPGEFFEVSWKNLEVSRDNREVFSNESESVHGKPEVSRENPGVSSEKPEFLVKTGNG